MRGPSDPAPRRSARFRAQRRKLLVPHRAHHRIRQIPHEPTPTVSRRPSRALPGCPRNLLADRLSKLVEHGVLDTGPYQEDGARSRFRYTITAKGNDLVPAVLGLLQWGYRYRADPAGPAVITPHRGCGATLSVQVRCERDHHVEAAEVEAVSGPAFRTRTNSNATSERRPAAPLEGATHY